MRHWTVLLALLLGCDTVEEARPQGYLKNPSNIIYVSWQLPDLTTLASASPIRLRLTTDTGKNPPSGVIDALANAVTVRRPDAELAQLTFDLSHAVYTDTMDSV